MMFHSALQGIAKNARKAQRQADRQAERQWQLANSDVAARAEAKRRRRQARNRETVERGGGIAR